MQTWTAEESCWLYWRHYHKTTKGINIRKFKNFDKQREDVLKWVIFEKLAIVANESKINLNEYVPLVAKKAKEAEQYFHPKALIHPHNLQMWTRMYKNAERTEAQQKIVDSFMKSFVFIITFCKNNGIRNLNEYFNVAIRTGSIDLQIASGRLSKYLLSLLPTNSLILIKQNIEPDIAHQLNEMTIKNKEALCSNTVTALRELRGIEITAENSLAKLIDKNIRKNVTN